MQIDQVFSIPFEVCKEGLEMPKLNFSAQYNDGEAHKCHFLLQIH